MGLKILHTADWHLDSPFGSVPEHLRQEFRQMQRTIPGKIADLCIQEGCDLVLLAGDIFDGKASPESVEALRRGLARCRVPVFISPGNHDFYAPGSPWVEESWPENVHFFTGNLAYYEWKSLNCRIYGAGYRSMDCPSLLSGLPVKSEMRYNIAVLHGDPLNSASPCCPVTAAQVRSCGLDYLALGHIHKSGSFRAGSTLCAWPGCPMGRGWDETGKKGVYLVNLEETAEISWVPLDFPEFHVESVDISQGTEAALEAVLPPAPSPDLYRITLEGIGAPDLPALQERFRELAYLELRSEAREETDPFAAAGEDSLRGVYFRMLQEAKDDPDCIRLAAEISEALLDGREVPLL